MKSCLKRSVPLLVLCSGLISIPTDQGRAQTLVPLHSFPALSDVYSGTNSDGSGPSGLVLGGGTLYGTASGGGYYGYGGVFAISTTDAGFTNLYNFTGGNDGAYPGALTSGDNTLYGTASSGGGAFEGTVFSLSLPGPPRLAIELSGTNVILTWPANATGYPCKWPPTLRRRRSGMEFLRCW
jgi:uncharacterized repeat protein (TIGR03803 family)